MFPQYYMDSDVISKYFQTVNKRVKTHRRRAIVVHDTCTTSKEKHLPRFTRNSEEFNSKFLENLEEMPPQNAQ